MRTNVSVVRYLKHGVACKMLLEQLKKIEIMNEFIVYDVKLYRLYVPRVVWLQTDSTALMISSLTRQSATLFKNLDFYDPSTLLQCLQNIIIFKLSC